MQLLLVINGDFRFSFIKIKVLKIVLFMNCNFVVFLYLMNTVGYNYEVIAENIKLYTNFSKICLPGLVAAFPVWGSHTLPYTVTNQLICIAHNSKTINYYPIKVGINLLYTPIYLVFCSPLCENRVPSNCCCVSSEGQPYIAIYCQAPTNPFA